MKKYVLCCFAVLAITVLSGCNTINGAGKDMTEAGRSVEKASGK